MIDIFTLRIIAGLLLASSLLVIYVVNFKDGKDSESYEVQSEVPIANSIEVVGSIVTILVPLVVIVLLVLIPTTVYETVLNINFIGATLVQVVGTFLFIMGGVLLLWSARHLGKFDTGRIAVAQDHVLVDSGPYTKVRHPGYTATFLIALAIFFISLNILLILNLVAAAGYFEYRARLEEKLLSSQEGFGNEYLSYMSRTGRFFPRL